MGCGFALFVLPAVTPPSSFLLLLGSQHHVDKALNLIGKKFKELNLTNIYAPPLPSLALPSLPLTSWVSMLLGDQDFLHPFPPTRNSQDHGLLIDASALSLLASTGLFCF